MFSVVYFITLMMVIWMGCKMFQGGESAEHCKSIGEFPLLSCQISCCNTLLGAVPGLWERILWGMEVIMRGCSIAFGAFVFLFSWFVPRASTGAIMRATFFKTQRAENKALFELQGLFLVAVV